MALAPKLQQRQTQSLVMTPQLQQAIKLLQLSNIELALFVEEQLESNPLLERGTGDENRREEKVSENSDTAEFTDVEISGTSSAESQLDAPDHAVDSEAGVSDRMDSTPADVGGTVDWSKAGSGGSFNGSDGYDAIDQAASEKTLRDVLTEQLGLLNLAASERPIAVYLIEHVDERGYLRLSTEETAQNLGISDVRVQSVLTQLQTFEPTGVFARSLQECLAIQLRENGDYDGPMQALVDNLELLAKHDLGKLAQSCGVNKGDLHEMTTRLRALSPKPGLAYGSDVSIAVEPDVYVRETPHGGWTVELNSDTLPRVLVDQRYLAEINANVKDDQTRTFISDCHQNASWLIKSLDQRARTILKVSSEIVRQQDGFFAFGVDHLRPLNLKTIAEAINMHESTISRVTTNKYMATPRGLLEFKYFFTAAIPALNGGEAYSAETVRNRIKVLITEETAERIYSDDRLVQLLRGEGIDVARRTVAKYRESLGIPSSVIRRRQLRNA